MPRLYGTSCSHYCWTLQSLTKPRRYDSVVITGDLRWQDRLNNYNLPFFIPSTGFFTNYTVNDFLPNHSTEA